MVRVDDVVAEIVPAMFSEIIDLNGFPPTTNLSQSNRCDLLSRNLAAALVNRGLEAHCEEHRLQDGRWHYLVSHEPMGQIPTETDLMTDLNPWQYLSNNRFHARSYRYLHGPRDEIQAKLKDKNAPEWFISLRGISTIVNELNKTRVA